MSAVLDALYGSCITPTALRSFEHSKQPASLRRLDKTTGKELSDYMKAVAAYDIGHMIHHIFGMLWLIDSNGHIYFCMEEVYDRRKSEVATLFPRNTMKLPSWHFKLGHPSLLPQCKRGDLEAKQARLGGDILFEPDFDGAPAWIITRTSGRYGSRKDFQMKWLIAVADEFRSNGVDLIPFDEWGVVE